MLYWNRLRLVQLDKNRWMTVASTGAMATNVCDMPPEEKDISLSELAPYARVLTFLNSYTTLNMTQSNYDNAIDRDQILNQILYPTHNPGLPQYSQRQARRLSNLVLTGYYVYTNREFHASHA